MGTLEVATSLAEAAIRGAAFAVEALAAALILAVTARAVWGAARAFATGDGSLQDVRFAYVQGLVFSLEFLVAGDLLHTIVAPTLNAVLIVGAIIVVRTILVLALEYELQQRDARAKSESH